MSLLSSYFVALGRDRVRDGPDRNPCAAPAGVPLAGEIWGPGGDEVAEKQAEAAVTLRDPDASSEGRRL